ncbi:MAG: bile acid:sodium symporter family protein [Bacteroidales bacterium]|nr:bile acid:sodium symporter family protein [Bacteroidales bacterium]
MNTIWIVMPILIILMFLLGIGLKVESFKEVFRRPKAVLVGTFAQIILLPAVAFGVASFFELPPLFFMGMMLIACSPGGSSSNVFSMLAKGDVALSITLTAISSVVTLFTIPVIMGYVAQYVSVNSGMEISLPVGKLLVQNILLVFLPMLVGVLFKLWKKEMAQKVEKVLGKLAFPALMILASVFFFQYPDEIISNFSLLGVSVSVLILSCMLLGVVSAYLFGLKSPQRRTIVIEVGMQNAAQAIAIASSPFVFNSGPMAIPAIIYALMMNVFLLLYVAYSRRS